MTIILVGFMGAGKTTIANSLAKILNLQGIDLDAEIIKEVGMSINLFFAKFGESAFRKKETLALLANLRREIVLATGGGIITRSYNRSVLKKQLCIYLKAKFSTLVQRIDSDSANLRPLANRNNLQKIFDERQAYYEEVASLVIRTDGKTPDEISQEIINKLELKEQ